MLPSITSSIVPRGSGREIASWSSAARSKIHRKTRSTQIKRPGKLEHALRRWVPPRRGVGVIVKVAPHAYQFGARREGEVAAHRRAGHYGMKLRQLRAIDEVDVPFAFDMRTAIEHVVRKRMGVTTKPKIDRARMLGHIVLEGLHLRFVADEIEIGRSLRDPVGAVILAAAVGAVRVLLHPFEVTRPDRRFPQHVMMAGDDDFAIGPRPLDLAFPPLKGFGGYGAGGRTAAGGHATDGIWQVVSIAHHQHADIAKLEGVALPGAVDRIRALGIVDERGLGMLTERIGPFAEPPIRLLTLTRWGAMGRCIVIARDIVDLLAPMLFQNAVLPDHLTTLLVLGCIPEARIVTEIERKIPRNGRCADGAAVLRLA